MLFNVIQNSPAANVATLGYFFFTILFTFT